jgi:uncharacterized OB-fold protein
VSDLTIPPPRPLPDPLTQFFWDGVAQHRLMALRCDRCGKFIHPPRAICRFCLCTSLTPTELSGRATLYTWTVAEQAFHPFFADKLPYVYATVELEEQAGLRMVTNIVDHPFEDLIAGMPLEVTFRDVGDGLILPQFRPATAADEP